MRSAGGGYRHSLPQPYNGLRTCKQQHVNIIIHRFLADRLADSITFISAGEGFSVAFDPLDGSSIVDTNFTVGTIFGVWPGDKLVGVTGRDQVFNPLPRCCHRHCSMTTKQLSDCLWYCTLCAGVSCNV